MLLKHGDRHHPAVGIVKMQAGFFGLNAPRALHQHACYDLQTVGDAVLKLLQQDMLLANEIVLPLSRYGIELDRVRLDALLA